MIVYLNIFYYDGKIRYAFHHTPKYNIWKYTTSYFLIKINTTERPPGNFTLEQLQGYLCSI